MIKRLCIAFFLCFIPLAASAQTPCPSEMETEKPAVPTEKCKTNLGDTAPVLFVFPDEKKAAPEPAREIPKAQEADEKKTARTLPETCTYTGYAWDTRKGRSTDHFDVSKPYAEVTDDERDPKVPDCTICIEDQVLIQPETLGIKASPIRICHVYAEEVKNALKEIKDAGDFDIEKLEGYRPGKTRGPVDQNGLRTQWSQHSYGTALDINANHNAIYSQCPDKLTGRSVEVKTCKRGIGGAWEPEKKPRVSITKDGTVYRIMTKFWKWGGEIDGTTKDIMHFSVTGY